MDMRLSHIHYEEAMTSLLNAKRILISNERFDLAGRLDTFIDSFITRGA